MVFPSPFYGEAPIFISLPLEGALMVISLPLWGGLGWG